MFRYTLLAILLAFFTFGTVGCSFSTAQEDEDEPADPLTFETIATDGIDLTTLDEGNYSSLFEGEQNVIRDPQSFATFWSRIYANRSSPPEPPAVDFSEKMVVGVVLGGRPNGGYRVEISEATHDQDDDLVRVSFTEYEPGSGCVATQALTSPYHIVAMDAVSSDTQVEFVKTGTETRSCD